MATEFNAGMAGLTLLAFAFYTKLIAAVNVRTFDDAKLSDVEAAPGPLRRIVGGQPVTDIKRYPYMVALIHEIRYYKVDHAVGRFFCTGTIVTPSLVLTAAHCVWDDVERRYRYTSSLVVAAGTVDLRDRGQKARVAGIYVHPKYTLPPRLKACAVEYDVAILKLARALEFNENVTAVRLPAAAALGSNLSRTVTTAYTETNKQCTALGWGLTAYTSGDVTEGTAHLHRLESRMHATQDCRALQGEQDYGEVPPEERMCADSQFCVYDWTGRSGVCLGDSGGPLVCDGVQVGLVSYGVSHGTRYVCVGMDNTDVYTRLDVFMDFIGDVMVRDAAAVRTSVTSLLVVIVTSLYCLLQLFIDCNL